VDDPRCVVIAQLLKRTDVLPLFELHGVCETLGYDFEALIQLQRRVHEGRAEPQFVQDDWAVVLLADEDKEACWDTVLQQRHAQERRSKKPRWKFVEFGTGMGSVGATLRESTAVEFTQLIGAETDARCRNIMTRVDPAVEMFSSAAKVPTRHPALRDADGIVAFIPCQSYTPINEGAVGDADTRPSTMIPAVVQSVLASQPMWLILENVPNFVGSHWHRWVVDVLEQARYSAATTSIFNDAEMGGGQNSERWVGIWYCRSLAKRGARSLLEGQLRAGCAMPKFGLSEVLKDSANWERIGHLEHNGEWTVTRGWVFCDKPPASGTPHAPTKVGVLTRGDKEVAVHDAKGNAPRVLRGRNALLAMGALKRDGELITLTSLGAFRLFGHPDTLWEAVGEEADRWLLLGNTSPARITRLVAEACALVQAQLPEAEAEHEAARTARWGRPKPTWIEADRGLAQSMPVLPPDRLRTALGNLTGGYVGAVDETVLPITFDLVSTTGIELCLPALAAANGSRPLLRAGTLVVPEGRQLMATRLYHDLPLLVCNTAEYGRELSRPAREQGRPSDMLVVTLGPDDAVLPPLLAALAASRRKHPCIMVVQRDADSAERIVGGGSHSSHATLAELLEYLAAEYVCTVEKSASSEYPGSAASLHTAWVVVATLQVIASSRSLVPSPTLPATPAKEAGAKARGGIGRPAVEAFASPGALKQQAQVRHGVAQLVSRLDVATTTHTGGAPRVVARTRADEEVYAAYNTVPLTGPFNAEHALPLVNDTRLAHASSDGAPVPRRMQMEEVMSAVGSTDPSALLQRLRRHCSKEELAEVLGEWLGSCTHTHLILQALLRCHTTLHPELQAVTMAAMACRAARLTGAAPGVLLTAAQPVESIELLAGAEAVARGYPFVTSQCMELYCGPDIGTLVLSPGTVLIPRRPVAGVVQLRVSWDSQLCQRLPLGCVCTEGCSCSAYSACQTQVVLSEGQRSAMAYERHTGRPVCGTLERAMGMLERLIDEAGALLPAPVGLTEEEAAALDVASATRVAVLIQARWRHRDDVTERVLAGFLLRRIAKLLAPALCQRAAMMVAAYVLARACRTRGVKARFVRNPFAYGLRDQLNYLLGHPPRLQSLPPMAEESNGPTMNSAAAVAAFAAQLASGAIGMLDVQPVASASLHCIPKGAGLIFDVAGGPEGGEKRFRRESYRQPLDPNLYNAEFTKKLDALSAMPLRPGERARRATLLVQRYLPELRATAEEGKARLIYDLRRSGFNEVAVEEILTMQNGNQVARMIASGATVMLTDRWQGYTTTGLSKMHSLLFGVERPAAEAGGERAGLDIQDECGYTSLPMGAKNSCFEYSLEELQATSTLGHCPPFKPLSAVENPHEARASGNMHYDVRQGDIHLLTVAGLPASTVAKFIDDTTMAAGGGNLDPKLQPRLVLISQQVAQLVDTHQGMANNDKKSSKPAQREVKCLGGEINTVQTVSEATEYRNTAEKLEKGRLLLNKTAAFGGVNLQPLVDQHLPDTLSVTQAIDAACAQGPLVAALQQRGGVQVPRLLLMKTLGYFSHLAEGMRNTAPLLQESWRDLYHGTPLAERPNWEEMTEEQTLPALLRATRRVPAAEHTWAEEGADATVLWRPAAITDVVLCLYLLRELRLVASNGRMPAREVSDGGTDASETCLAGYMRGFEDHTQRSSADSGAAQGSQERGASRSAIFSLDFNPACVVAGGAGLKELMGIEVMVRRGLEISQGDHMGDPQSLPRRAAAWEEAVQEQWRQNGLPPLEAEQANLKRACHHLVLRLNLDAAAAVHATARGSSRSNAWTPVLNRIGMLCLGLGVVLVVCWTHGHWKIRFGEDGISRGDDFRLQQSLKDAAMSPYEVMGFGSDWRPTERVKQTVEAAMPAGASWVFGDNLLSLYRFEVPRVLIVMAHPSTAVSVFHQAISMWARDRYSCTLGLVTAMDRQVPGLTSFLRKAQGGYHVVSGAAEHPWPMVYAVVRPLERPPVSGPQVYRTLVAPRARRALPAATTRRPVAGVEEETSEATTVEVADPEVRRRRQELEAELLQATDARYEILTLMEAMLLRQREARLTAPPTATTSDLSAPLTDPGVGRPRGLNEGPRSNLVDGVVTGKTNLVFANQARAICVLCRTPAKLSDLFGCAGALTGLNTVRFGATTACHYYAHPKCFAELIPRGERPSWTGASGTTLGPADARNGEFVCPVCSWFAATGRRLSPFSIEDEYIYGSIVAALVDMCRDRAESTNRQYAWLRTTMLSVEQLCPELTPHLTGRLQRVDYDAYGEGIAMGVLMMVLEHKRNWGWAAIGKMLTAHNAAANQIGASTIHENLTANRVISGMQRRLGLPNKKSPALMGHEMVQLVELLTRLLAQAQEIQRAHEARPGLRHPLQPPYATCGTGRDEVTLHPVTVSSMLQWVTMAYFGFLRSGEYLRVQAAQVIADFGTEAVAKAEVHPLLAQQLYDKSGQQRLQYLLFDLNGPTKTNQTGAAKVVIFGNPQCGLPVFDNAVRHARLLWSSSLLAGPWICDGGGEVIPVQVVLRGLLRPLLSRLATSGAVPRLRSFRVQDFSLNTMRRGGNSHAADMGAERWMRCGHGRWSAGAGGGSLHMIDYYDEISVGRRLLVTACM
jgi:site-specific DNA-cytosine methylase